MADERYLPTGNEMISIPDIREKDAAVMSVTFLHMGFKLYMKPLSPSGASIVPLTPIAPHLPVKYGIQ